jgi:ribose transport system substrate-binding protein
MTGNPRHLRLILLLAGLVLLLNAAGCHRSSTQSIAVIPQTSGTILWEPENVGAQLAAAEVGERIYWNAATREDDVDGQIALVEKVVAKRYRGLVLAPDHSLALIAPVRRALERGLPIVIVGSPMPIPANSNLCYVLNDEEEGGRLAAERVAALTHGKGEVALLGIDPDVAGLMLRANSFETFLTRNYPGIRIVVRRQGTLNFAHEQEEAEEVLRQNPGLNVIVALTSAATRGALSTIESSHQGAAVKVIGFEPDSVIFDNASLDSLIVQNTRAMGDRAVRLIHARLEGQLLPARVVFKPLLVSRENVGSKMIQDMVDARWQPGATPLKRSFQ